MVDKRRVDELSIEELEQILAIRKREARQRRLQRLKQSGRVIESRLEPQSVVPVPDAPSAAARPMKQAAQQHPTPRAGLPQFDDDVSYVSPTTKRNDAIWRRFVDRSLLLVEIAAVVGLVMLGVTMFSGIGELEQKTAEAQALADEQRRAGIPTLEPTPQLSVSQFVLPGGHPPLVAQFNYDEVPQNLRYLVQQEIMAPVIVRPPQTDDTARCPVRPSVFWRW